MNNQQLNCQVCNDGQLKKKKKYRMSGPVVTIGYILLIPSILGMMFGFFMMFATGSATVDVNDGIKTEIRNELTNHNIPNQIIDKVINRTPLTEDDKTLLNNDQQRAINDAKLSYGAGQLGAGAGTALAGGLSIFMIISSFVGGLLGWLLIMKKKVLQCINCNAVIAAS